MNDEKYNSIVQAEDTSGLSRDEQLSYIRKVREEWETDENPNNDNMLNEWSEADMMREMVYHDRGYRFLDMIGLGDTGIGKRLRKVDFEPEQTFKTYLFRAFGNIMFW